MKQKIYLTELPEYFVYNDTEFCIDLSQLMDYLEINEESEINELPDDWSEIVEETKLERLMDFNIDELMQLITNSTDDRCSEDGNEYDRLEKILKANINFDQIQKEMPELYYPTGRFYRVTKKDLMEYCTPPRAETKKEEK